MSRILLIDTNISSFPIYDYLANNNEVYVVGSNSDDYLARTVKNYINIDYSEVDQLKALIKSLDIEYIVPGCNDLSYQISAELNSESQFFGLDTVEVTSILNNKEKFRVFAKILGVPVPNLISKTEIESVIPNIIKPVDSYSGRGVTIIHEPDKRIIDTAIKKAKEYSRSNSCIIEEYVEGQLYSHSAFISEGVILTDFIVAEYGTANPFVVDTSYVVNDFPIEALNNIREWIVLMIKELKLVDGLVHTQFIKNRDKVWFIEITRRCPGDLYSLLIEKSTGFKYSEAYTRPFLNQKPIKSEISLEKLNVLRHTISLPNERVFSSLKYKFPVQIELYFPLTITGTKIQASPFGRIGLLFLISDSKSEFQNLINNTLKRELYEIY